MHIEAVGWGEKKMYVYRFFRGFVPSFFRQKHKLVINLFVDINYGLRAAHCIYGYVVEAVQKKKKRASLFMQASVKYIPELGTRSRSAGSAPYAR